MSSEPRREISMLLSELHELLNVEANVIATNGKLPRHEGKNTSTIVEEFADPDTPVDVLIDNLEQLRVRVEVLRKIMDEKPPHKH